jgi:cytochrome c peroxidase
MKRYWLLNAALALSLYACQEAEKQTVSSVIIPEFTIPDDNPVTAIKAELGRRLFYERGLSLDSSVACASCHIQRFAFSDTAKLSSGFKGSLGFRNSSTLANIVYNSSFFREGGVTTIERAVHPPVLTEFEMNMNTDSIVARLNANPAYRDMFLEAFGQAADYKTVVYALATFQRSLLSFNTPYDRFMAGDSSALTAEEKEGLALFSSKKLNCTTCHKEPFFMDNIFHNIGVYQVYTDYGRGRFTLDSADFGKMRTPSLRNVAVTWPYMHDGSMRTLEEVVAFYKTGGVNHANKSSEMKPFELTESEEKALLAFLNALTDSTFLTNPAFSAP